MLAAFNRKDGSYKWHRTWGGNNYDDAYGMTSSPDGSLYLTGPTMIGSGTQLFTLKYSHKGDFIWSKLWGGNGGEGARTLATDGDSILYIGVNTESYGAGMNDIALVKYDSSGVLLNYKTWGGFERDVVSGMVKKDDYMYIAGNTRSFGPKDMNALLLKMNARTMTFPDTLLTDVSKMKPVKEFFLSQNYPNPFSDQTTIRFQISDYGFQTTEISNQKSAITLKVYDVFGREVLDLSDQANRKSEIVILKSQLTIPGIYFYQLISGKQSQTRMMIYQH